MNLSIIIEDKSIVKNNDYFTVEDSSWWNQFTDIHAIQINEDNNINEVELKDGNSRQATTSEINIFKNKIAELEAKEIQDAENWNNSWDRVKIDRNLWLNKTDKYMIEDFAISTELRNTYKTYRENLRDIPSTYSSSEPKNIVFDELGNVKVNENIVITKPSE